MKKNNTKKSRDTVPLSYVLSSNVHGMTAAGRCHPEAVGGAGGTAVGRAAREGGGGIAFGCRRDVLI